MSDTRVSPAPPPSHPADSPRPDGAVAEHTEGLSLEVGGEEEVDRRLAVLEMVGEETSAGWKPAPHQPLSPEVRFLHSSRTIHQLITDRNRSVSIFLFVASLLFGGSTALLNAPPAVAPIIPLKGIQYWCMPVTFGTLALLAVSMALILIRTRIGLIYEVAKMNALLGLPAERVKRVNPLSIFFQMYLMVVVLGGASAGFTVAMLRYPGAPRAARPIGVGLAVAAVYVVGFLAVYYLTILRATTETKLQGVKT
jgi:hypothetical protein